MSDSPIVPPNLPGLELVESIARTNLSDVWKGIRQSDGADIVVKLPTTTSGPEMLLHEAETTQALKAAGVRGIVPAEYKSEPMPHLVLPWKGGRTLREAITTIGGGNDRSRAMETFFEIVDVVSRVHREGYLHGDLKPENVILDDAGSPWLTDFGMARAIQSARLDTHVSVSMSRSEGRWGGTLHYMPPEGLHGDAPTKSWDVYALGVMLHEMLLGRRPDRAATPDHLRTVLPGEVVEVLLEALAYSPEERIGTADRLLQGLGGIRSELIATGPARLFHRAGRLALAGFAAFFVALRYGMVFVLVAGYLAIGAASYFNHPGFLIIYAPFLLLHATIRWEGPETPEEQLLRLSGGPIGRR